MESGSASAPHLSHDGRTRTHRKHVPGARRYSGGLAGEKASGGSVGKRTGLPFATPVRGRHSWSLSLQMRPFPEAAYRLSPSTVDHHSIPRACRPCHRAVSSTSSGQGSDRGRGVWKTTIDAAAPSNASEPVGGWTTSVQRTVATTVVLNSVLGVEHTTPNCSTGRDPNAGSSSRRFGAACAASARARRVPNVRHPITAAINCGFGGAEPATCAEDSRRSHESVEAPCSCSRSFHSRRRPRPATAEHEATSSLSPTARPVTQRFSQRSIAGDRPHRSIRDRVAERSFTVNSQLTAPQVPVAVQSRSRAFHD